MDKPRDLSEAITHCRLQCDRLGLAYKDPIVMLWIWAQGKKDWHDLEYEDFRDLYTFLARCDGRRPVGDHRKSKQLEFR